MNKLFESYRGFYREIDAICEKAPLFARTRLQPPHLLINTESEFEQLYVLQSMTETFESKGVMDFSLASDRFLYYKFDGTLRQLQKNFANIQSSATTANHYRYIIGFDITKLVSRSGEMQGKEFFERINEVAKHACCVFFVESLQSSSVERFIKKLKECLKSCTTIAIPPFTYDDLASIATYRLRNVFGMDCTSCFETALSAYLSTVDIKNTSDAFDFSEKLLWGANLTSTSITLDSAVFTEFLEKRKETRNSEIGKMD